MLEAKRPLKVFLCHAHSDKDAVKTLYDRLVRDDVDAWLDKEKLLGGADWEYEIRNAVRDSDVVLVCHSKQFNQKGFRQKEVKIALEEADLLPKGEIFIIPLRLEECEVLDDLKKWHWVDLFEKDGYEMLMRALRARADRIGATLQIKKGWLPKVNTQPIVIKKPSKFPEEEGLKTDSPKRSIVTKEIAAKFGQSIKNFFRRLLPLLRILGVLIVLSGLFWVGSWVISKFPPQMPISTASSTPTHRPNPTFTFTSSPPTKTSTPRPTLTRTRTPGPTALPTEITDDKGTSMLLVPAGTFMMGNDSANDFSWNAKPSHSIYLDAFYIDKYEITNKQFAIFLNTFTSQMSVTSNGEKVNSNGYLIYFLHIPPKWNDPAENRADKISWNGEFKYTAIEEFEDQPAESVTWYGAIAYCEWAMSRLPTEAEWEKAARDLDGQDVQHKIYGMIESVPEWTSSTASQYPYDSNDGRENLSIFVNRIYRGLYFSFYYRQSAPPYQAGIGFRCARSIP